jgi:hypothetical protein
MIHLTPDVVRAIQGFTRFLDISLWGFSPFSLFLVKSLPIKSAKSELKT